MKEGKENKKKKQGFWSVPAALAWIAGATKDHCNLLHSWSWASISTAFVSSTRYTKPINLRLYLEDALRSGKVTALAVKNRSGIRLPIDSSDWNGLTLQDGPTGVIAAAPCFSDIKLKLSEILIPVSEVRKTWPHTAEKSNGRPRGIRPVITQRVTDGMKKDLESGKLTSLVLENMTGDALAAQYECSRYTAVKVRCALQSAGVLNSDK
jgi:hypothetical protein